MEFVVFICVILSIGFATGKFRFKSRKLTMKQNPQTGEIYYESDSFDDYAAAQSGVSYDAPEHESESSTVELTNEERAAINAERIFSAYSTDLQKSMADLEVIARIHQQYLTGEKQEYNLTDEIFGLYKSVRDLFDRIENIKTYENLEIDYSRNIAKISTLLGDQYYVNVAMNSTQWDDAEARMSKVRETLASMTQQAYGDIQKVNASNDVELDAIFKTLENSSEKQGEIHNIFKDVPKNKKEM